jgi:hypothetical protein
LFDGGSHSRLREEYPYAPRSTGIFAEAHDLTWTDLFRTLSATLR